VTRISGLWRHPVLGKVYQAIVGGTDVQLTYRVLATGSPRLLDVSRLR
jgi:hypothetical protein